MVKISLLALVLVIFNGCVNKRGISLKYYNDCEEYYDMQGYYHKKCDDKGMVTYKEIGDAFKEEKKKPKGNVY